MNFICIIREPYIDKIPSLKTLLWYLSQKGCQIIIVSSKEDKYPLPSFENQNIRVICVRKRTNKIEIPTSIKLGWEFIKCYIKQKPTFCIGGDIYGNLILGSLKKVFNFKHICFLLEYPQIITDSHHQLSKIEKQEIEVLKKASFIITHDDYHKQFLLNNFKLHEDKILILPNATFTSLIEYQSVFLQKRLHLATDQKIVLHSGGLGIWFKCKKLAESTQNWPDDTLLVFHTSHDVSEDPYYKELICKNYNKKVFFSIKPVSTFDLDSLVCSASIGIALYSTEYLGYRAELLGLAAGKIGNYLKCGLPVIATNLISFTYLVDFSCGILIDDESEIAAAITKINSNYVEYSRNALKCYQEIWEPTKYLNNIFDVLAKV